MKKAMMAATPRTERPSGEESTQEAHREKAVECHHHEGEGEAAKPEPHLVAETGREYALVVERFEPEVVHVQTDQGVEDDQDQEDDRGYKEDPSSPPADPYVAEVGPPRRAPAEEGLDVVEEIAAAPHQLSLTAKVKDGRMVSRRIG
jgi:hypothetical protein